MASVGTKDFTYPQPVVSHNQDGNEYVPFGKSIRTIDVNNNVWDILDGNVQAVSKWQMFALVNTSNAAGGAGSWLNLEPSAIMITRVVIDINTLASAACAISAGIGPIAATLDSSLIYNLSVGSGGSTGPFDNFSSNGTSGKSIRLLAQNAYVTVSTYSGAIAGLIANFYVQYVVPLSSTY